MADEVLAVPLFGEEVAPRFCSAREFLVAEIGENGAGRRARLLVVGLDWSQRLDLLAAQGVSVVLCAGFGRRIVPSADVRGIRVVTCLTGRAEELIAAYADGDLERHRFPRQPETGDCCRTKGPRRVQSEHEKDEGHR